MKEKYISEKTVFNSLITFNGKLDASIEPMCCITFYPQSQEKVNFSGSLREKLEYDNKMESNEMIDDFVYIFEGFEKLTTIDMKRVGRIYVFTQSPTQEKIWIKFENHCRTDNNHDGLVDIYFNYNTKTNIVRNLRKGTLLEKLNSPVNVFISKYLTPISIVTASVCVVCIIAGMMFRNKTKI
jgi:hypothetical protein